YGSDLWQSTDRGENWNLFYHAPKGITSLAVMPNGDMFLAYSIYHIIDIGHFDHYLASENRWEQLAIDADSTSSANNVNHFTIASTGELYAVTGAGVFRSDDNGKNWQSMNKGIDSLSVQDVAAAPD